MKLFNRQKEIDDKVEQAATNQREFVNKDLDQSFKAYVIRQFKKNKLAVLSLYFAGALALVAVFADFIANDKPIACSFEGTTYFPVFKDYAVDWFGSKWQPEFQNITWKDLKFDWVVWPLVPYTPQNLDFMNSQYVGPGDDQDVPSAKWHHWMGTDELGRDVLSGMIHGTRIAFLVGIVSMSISTLIGIFFGALAGFFGDDRIQMSRIRMWLNVIFVVLGFFYAFVARSLVIVEAFEDGSGSGFLSLLLSLLILLAFIGVGNALASVLKRIPVFGKKTNIPVDLIVTRLIEIIVSVPRLILIMSVLSLSKTGGLFTVMLIIGLTSWTGIARFIRAELLRVRNLEFMEAAEALGYSNFRRLLKHGIPNALNPVFISVAFGIASAILIESTLSFLGIGVSADTVTWGKLLSIARSAPGAWWLAIFPGLAIFLAVTIFNLIGEGLTDALDPRLKK